MKLSIVFTSIIRPRVQGTRALQKLSKLAAVGAAKLRDFAPYAAMELVLPGGSLMALLLWLYRRHKEQLRG
jgi:hypothetical protein